MEKKKKEAICTIMCSLFNGGRAWHHQTRYSLSLSFSFFLTFLLVVIGAEHKEPLLVSMAVVTDGKVGLGDDLLFRVLVISA